MAWCPLCGSYWLIRSGQKVKHGLLGRSNTDVIDPPDMVCPTCGGDDA